VARRESADRSQGSPETSAATGGLTKGLATSSLQRTLEELSLLAAIRGDSAEQALLAQAIAFVQARGIEADGDLGPLFETPDADADPAVVKRLRQMYEAGGWVLVESTLADLPADLRWLYESGAVTLEQLAAIHRTLGVTAAVDLALAINDGSLRMVEGLDESIESTIAAAVPTLRASTPRIPLGRAVALAEPLVARLRAVPGVAWAAPAGSLRRGQDMVGDIEIVAASSDPAAAIEQVLQDSDATRCLHSGERRVYLRVDRVQVGIRLPEPPNAGTELLFLTGASRHIETLRAHASEKGYRLTRGGLASATGLVTPAASEDDIYGALGLPCIPPEIRNGDGEVAAAARGELPDLVSRREIRGDLHMHSTWSDGRDPIEVMVRACRALGYEYMAITDHSPTSAASRNLSADGVKKQADEIAQIRERHPDIQILHGCEVDILSDGRLDFPDRILEQFDIVLASLHEGLGHSSDQLMKRYTAAMTHPLVTMITHPTNRVVPHRAGYDLDYDRLFETARETATIVEVDGSPSHLDLDGALARRAVEAGVTVAVDSDCHRADLLARQMHLGIVTARRGWVEPRHVLNTRVLAEVRAVIASKRNRR
jgi:DNA polymerase (family 10)